MASGGRSSSSCEEQVGSKRCWAFARRLLGSACGARGCFAACHKMLDAGGNVGGSPSGRVGWWDGGWLRLGGTTTSSSKALLVICWGLVEGQRSPPCPAAPAVLIAPGVKNWRCLKVSVGISLGGIVLILLQVDKSECSFCWVLG